MVSNEVSIDLDAFDDFEASAWEERVEGYTGFFGAVTGRLVEPLLDLARVGPGTRVLDVATGPGYVAAEAARRGGAVCAVDVAEAMVAQAVAEHPDVEFRQADAQSLPFEDGIFDAVVGNFGLPHFGRPELAVAEGVRVLAPGGRLALTTWDVPAEMRMFGVFLEAVADAGAGPPDGFHRGPMSSGFPTTRSFSTSSKDAASSTWTYDALLSPTPWGRSRTSGTLCNAGRFGWPRSCWVSRGNPRAHPGRPRAPPGRLRDRRRVRPAGFGEASGRP